MIFSSLLFLYLFLPLTLFFVFFARQKFANIVLFVASLIFCAWGGVSYTSILILSILINYASGLLIGNGKTRGKRKLYFLLGIFLNLGLLVVFKYTHFFFENFNLLFSLFDWKIILPSKKILLPLGISFYTFKAITYLFSVYREENKAEKNFINIALYISFFPQLAAGPIDRYSNLYPQILHREVSFEKFASGVRRFAIGFAKKVIISAPLAYTANQVFAVQQNVLDTPLAWLGIVCYTLQIYFDFSGYTDMAIGVGRMFGFTFVENFNFPYISKSVKEFWKRWHMSLSSWFRDYLFLPLAYSYSRKLKNDRYLHIRAEWIIYALATMITFTLCGFWHGAAWNFIIWGALHGIFLSLEQSRAGKILRKSFKPIQHLYFLSFLLLSWVFFRTSTPAEAFGYIGVMFGGGSVADWSRFYELFDKELIITGVIALLSCTTFFAGILQFAEKQGSDQQGIIRNSFFHLEKIASVIFIVSVMVIGTIMLTSGTSNPFIYFNF